MYGGDLEAMLNQPGDYIGARRVRRLGPMAPDSVALELWDGDSWIACGYATDNDGIQRWLAGSPAPDGDHPWQPGTGRRRKRPTDPPYNSRRSA